MNIVANWSYPTAVKMGRGRIKELADACKSLGIKKPLLINAPMVDDNVFFQDVVRLVQRLIEQENINFETAIYPVEPHGFRQPSSWLDEYRRIYKLFEQNL